MVDRSICEYTNDNTASMNISASALRQVHYLQKVQLMHVRMVRLALPAQGLSNKLSYLHIWPR